MNARLADKEGFNLSNQLRGRQTSRLTAHVPLGVGNNADNP